MQVQVHLNDSQTNNRPPFDEIYSLRHIYLFYFFFVITIGYFFSPFLLFQKGNSLPELLLSFVLMNRSLFRNAEYLV